MAYLTKAFAVEWRKLVKSRLPLITIIAISFVPCLLAVFNLMMRNPDLIKNLGMLAAKANLMSVSDWSSYFKALSQVISVGGLLIFGFITSWVFGREYSEQTMIDLLVLPLKRGVVVLAKFIVIVCWCLILSILACLLAVFFGILLGLPQLDSKLLIDGCLLFLFCSSLTILLSSPLAFIACMGRGYLSPLAFLILTVLLSQVFSYLGLGAYFPWSVPALASGMTGKVILAPLGLVNLLVLAIAAYSLTVLCWKYKDYD